MAKIVSTHSFRGGTGKSNLTANVAAMVTCLGNRVGVIDTDIQSPGIHTVFQLEQGKIARSLNDYLWQRCSIEDAAYDVTATAVNGQNHDVAGKLFIIPSSLKTGEIAKILKEGYEVSRLHDGFQDIIRQLQLDYLFIDTHPGVNEETLMSIAISDVLLLILRPDKQDLQGTAVTLELARRLEVPKIYLALNKVPPTMQAVSLHQQIETLFRAPVSAILPLNFEVAELASGDLFVNRNPNHPFSKEVRRLVTTIVDGA